MKNEIWITASIINDKKYFGHCEKIGISIYFDKVIKSEKFIIFRDKSNINLTAVDIDKFYLDGEIVINKDGK